MIMIFHELESVKEKERGRKELARDIYIFMVRKCEDYRGFEVINGFPSIAN